MRIVFMGTPEFSVPVLRALADAGHDIVASYSQPPRPAGRGNALVPTPVHAAAEAMGIAVRTPPTLRDSAAQAEFAAFDADVAVVAAYGLILPRPVLAAPRHGCLNVHASLLPRWRGAAPIQRAIMAGDADTGVCIMDMETGLDTGPVRRREAIAIAGQTAGMLTNALSAMGARLMVAVLTDLAGHPPTPQTEDGITYAAKIDKAEARINWQHPADQIERQIRAFNPVPGAWFDVSGERIKLLSATLVTARGTPGCVLDDALTIACGHGTALRPVLLQRAGRGAMTAAELLRGFPIAPGTLLA